MSNSNSQSPEQVLKTAQQLWKNGKETETYEICKTCLRANPEHGPLLHFFAFVLEKQGNIFGAMKHLEFACKAPDSKSLYYLDLAKMMIGQNMYLEAQNVLNIAMKLDPSDLEIQTQLGSVLILNGFFDQGAKLFSFAVAQSPNDWKIWSLFARTVANSNRPQQAEELYEQTIAVARAARSNNQAKNVSAPTKIEIAQILINKADHKKTIGDVIGCENTIREILDLTTMFCRAWSELATLNAFTDQDLKTVENLLKTKKGELSPSDLQHLHYALGQVYTRLGSNKKAIENYLKANRIQRDHIDYNEESMLGYLRNLPNYYTAEAIAASKLSEDTPEQQFVFIVGLPRSGSSLLEQILDSHSDAFGVGEIHTMPNLHRRIYGQGFPAIPVHAQVLADPKRLTAFAKAYRTEVLRTLPPEALQDGKPPRFIVDKMLGNFVSVGLIAMAFPNSKIIHSRRDPVDTAFSCFTHFFADGHKYLCDLAEIGRFYLGYRDLMAHWEKAVPTDQLITVDYEKVIDDLDGEAHRLTDFLGLEWQEQCLEFYANKREVRTHSALEVRKPIYRTSVERWRPYEKELAPLFEALGITPA